MLYWNDYQIAKANHKEYEEAARQTWFVKKALESNGRSAQTSFLITLGRNLKRVFRKRNHSSNN